MIPQPIVCVLGMHRSGSSLAAQILAGNGFRTGRSQIGRSRFNAEGHFEDRFVVQTNKKLLLHFGGTWDRPPRLPLGWREDPAVRRLLERASRYRRLEVARRAPYFFKDPRTSLLIPFWREAFGPMKFLVVLRAPDSVVRSLMRRQNEWLQPRNFVWRAMRAVYHRLQGGMEPLRPLDVQQAEGLWSHYYECIAENLLSEYPTLLIYERLLQRPRSEIGRILHEFGVDPREASTDMVQPDLNHSGSSEVNAAVRAIERRLSRSRNAT